MSITLKQSPTVPEVFMQYPEAVRPKLEYLRQLILDTATEIETISEMEETLKWREPSYLVKKGSTIRMDYKDKNPNQYAMYFKCTSKLVPTFKEIFGDLFTYEGNRAIVFQLDDPVPEQELKACIRMALTYHLVKELPQLGWNDEGN